MTTVLRGITWGHRRAIAPLKETLRGFAIEHPGTAIEWSERSLAGFEFDPVPMLAERFDLIVLDHPFCGDIASSKCLVPLDGMNDLEDRLFVGPSLTSYRYDGHIWALPIDAAAQVAVSRPELMGRLDAEVPRTWQEVIRLGKCASRSGMHIGIALNGVHSLMTFYTLCANLGAPCDGRLGHPLVNRDVARDALDAIEELLSLAPQAVLDWDSIGLHEAMIAGDSLVYCPAVYLYATYAEPDFRHPLRFHDFPGLRGPDPSGSTLGGTGLGVSAKCRNVDAALAYAGYLLRSETQIAFGFNHGQPARKEAWTAPDLDARFGGAFSGTRATIEASWIRPRYPGYLRFQHEGGELIELHLRGEIGRRDLLDRLQQSHELWSGRAS
jgi:multiple sugar transport system substrate-binding protein